MGEVRAKVLLQNAADRELARRGAISEKDVCRLEADLLADTGAVLVK
jgi:hypothetical protein